MSGLQTFRAVRIDAAGDMSAEAGRPLIVRAATPELAADRVLNASSEAGYLDRHPLPLDIIVRDQTGDAKRFRCETIEGELATFELRACRICGCSDDRACAPPCAWVDDDLCSAPTCLAAAGAA